jgi:hypothetical protein
MVKELQSSDAEPEKLRAKDGMGERRVISINRMAMESMK